jgi:hypothetical protein
VRLVLRRLQNILTIFFQSPQLAVNPTPTPTPSPSSRFISPTTSASSSASFASAHSSNTATIAGSVVGAILFVSLLVLGLVLFLRWRRKSQTAELEPDSIKSGPTSHSAMPSMSQSEHTPNILAPPAPPLGGFTIPHIAFVPSSYLRSRKTLRGLRIF